MEKRHALIGARQGSVVMIGLMGPGAELGIAIDGWSMSERTESIVILAAISKDFVSTTARCEGIRQLCN